MSLSNRVARVAEVDLGGFLRRGRGRERDLGLGAVEDLGADRVGEGADPRVIGLDRGVVVAARGVDAVLRAFQLILQRGEILQRLQFGITLLDHRSHQRADRDPDLGLGRVERRDLGRIGQIGRAERRLGGAGTRLADPDQDTAFLRGGGLHRLDQIADQVAAALVIGLDVGEAGVDILLRGRDRIQPAAGKADGGDGCEQQAAKARDGHCVSPIRNDSVMT